MSTEEEKESSRSSSRPIALDLFCGAGGLSLGFEMAGYDVALGIEKDPLFCATHELNFRGHSLQRDVSEIGDPSALLEELEIDHIDVIIGGPPCQGFSRVGRGKLRSLDRDHLTDGRNKMYLEFIRFVDELRPKFFVMENVPDIQSFWDQDGNLLEKAISRFSKLGYTCDWQVLHSQNFGVPQKRRRLFLVGNRLGLPIPWPKLELESNFVSVWDAISDLPIVPHNHRLDQIEYSPRFEQSPFQKRMTAGASGDVFNHQTRWHNESDLAAFDLLLEGGKYCDLPDEFKRYRSDIFRDKYWKLRRSEPSWTIEAHIGKDTYRHIYPSRQGEPEPARTISVREAARLQSFPDSFRFVGPFTRQFTQLGNAVPPLLARAVASAILSSLQRQTMSVHCGPDEI